MATDLRVERPPQMAVWRLSRRFVFRLPGNVPKLALVPDDVGPREWGPHQAFSMERDQNPSSKTRLREENQFLNARRKPSGESALMRFQADVSIGEKK